MNSKEKIPIHYFINGEFYGTGYQDEVFRGKKARKFLTFWSPHSWFAYCPVCGEVWARGLSSHSKARHLALKLNCRQHQGGSLILAAGNFEVDSLPKNSKFLLYELDLYFEDKEKYKLRTIIQQQRYQNE